MSPSGEVYLGYDYACRPPNARFCCERTDGCFVMRGWLVRWAAASIVRPAAPGRCFGRCSLRNTMVTFSALVACMLRAHGLGARMANAAPVRGVHKSPGAADLRHAEPGRPDDPRRGHTGSTGDSPSAPHTGEWRGAKWRAILAQPRFNFLSRRSRASGRPGSQPDESIANPTRAHPDCPDASQRPSLHGSGSEEQRRAAGRCRPPRTR